MHPQLIKTSIATTLHCATENRDSSGLPGRTCPDSFFPSAYTATEDIQRGYHTPAALSKF
ncbi:hypothetical protein CLDAP_17700 [Caldilinea aerophila DSM 14535 = NBRC 104270]|jgi:hypothetical protein|uniref:Uncharacterized protein n=1 Tax=Caldilinea aerophila (strain DSM 14535 / JCM 11387 / NBRC 104270 / STL-6-O1) TaxID=926550 RepID=I0I3H2_CALAS|nr:hypothetical protein CLDAP_17700 [Caldilinea aerophila DSM 14535 = NBRC 104270]